MVCPHCGREQDIAPTGPVIGELPLEAYFESGRLREQAVEEDTVHCSKCAAHFTVPSTRANLACPYCGSEVVFDSTRGERIPPNSLLPFLVTAARARHALGQWLGSRFWAPNDLKKLALKEGQLKGMYIPYWTFDSQTTTQYTGMRGIHYYETETYYTTVNGQRTAQTRTVRKTRWYPAAGVVFVPFDDVLVLASTAVPQEYAERLEEWDLGQVQPYQREYLAGFQTQLYDIDLPSGWVRGRDKMQPAIDRAIRADIGGDEQRITSKNTDYQNNTFKHVLLPMYAGSYRYKQKSHAFLVNGRTGEIQGSAPISFWKVFFAVLLGLLIAGGIFYVYQKNQPSSSSSVEFSTDPAYSPEPSINW